MWPLAQAKYGVWQSNHEALMTMHTKIAAATVLLTAGMFAAPASAVDLYAAVRSNATIARGVGAVSVTRNNPVGSYVVQFNRNITNCFFMGTIGRAGSAGSEPPSFISTVVRLGTTNSVLATTFDANGEFANRNFFLHVGCP
jgi:hypothetical protein